ncbi:MAG: hypothetical protein ACK5OX_11250 [Desertimonas sp.]
MSEATLQYRVVVAKKDERVEGPDDADVIVTVPVAAASAAEFDPTVAYMQGLLKSTGPTGPLLTALRDGSAADALSRLASPT